MLLLKKHFANVNNIPIALKISRHQNCLEIEIIRLQSLQKCSIISKGVLLIFTNLILLFYSFHQNTSIWLYIIIEVLILSVYIFIQLYTTVINESLLVLRSVGGIQYSWTNILGISDSQFYKSLNVVINEGITFNRVIFYLMLLDCDSNHLKNNDQVHLLFGKLLPKLDCLKYIYTYMLAFISQKDTKTKCLD